MGEVTTSLAHRLFLDRQIYRQLNNVTMRSVNDSTTQIDHLIVSKFGLFVMLFAGSVPGEALLRPYGSVFFDLAFPWTFFPFGAIPSSIDVVVPDIPIGTELVLQELAFDLFTTNGNFSNAVGLVVE